MESPIPTPFDIIEPSSGALTPTPLAWVLLLLVAGCGALLISALIGRSRSANKLSYTLKRLFNELCDAAKLITADSTSYPSATIERVTRITRRILAPLTLADTGGMSCSELRELSRELTAARSDPKSAELTEAISNALDLLAILEELTYAPHDKASLDNLAELINSLMQHLRVAVNAKQPLPIRATSKS
jgi:hypothetical protein